MRLPGCLLAIVLSPLATSLSFAVNNSTTPCNKDPKCNYGIPYIPSCDQLACCVDMGGINYCDSSAGRYVCNNGYYSSCYCTRHAVMDLQKIQGCCLWQGGVFTINEVGLVICNNGGISEVCSLQSAPVNVSSW